MKMNKLRTILFFLLFISISALASTAKIASFNALKLGKNKKDYELTASVISNFDVIGILEVMNRSGLEQLVKALERETKEKWEYKISPYSVGTASYKEYYAFIWRKKKVKLLCERGFYESPTKEFAREPYGVDFKIDNFDFTFVIIHVVFGKDERMRRGEIFKLNKVYDFFQDMDPNENDVIIAGDFNMSAWDESFENLLGHKDKIIYALDPSIKTTVGNNGLVSSYDNFFLSTLYTAEFTGKSGALDFTCGEYKFMKNNISDHLPIFIQVNTSKDDD